MNWSGIAIAVIFIVIAVGFGVEWATGVEAEDWPAGLNWLSVGLLVVALIILGREQMKEDREAEDWVDDPSKSSFQNWMAKRRHKFSPLRGAAYFFLALLIYPFILGIDFLFGQPFVSLERAAIFVLVIAVAAGLIGIFTEKTPF